MRNNVDLPAPLRPTNPTLAPSGIDTVAFSMSRRPAMRAEISLSVIMPALLADAALRCKPLSVNSGHCGKRASKGGRRVKREAARKGPPGCACHCGGGENPGVVSARLLRARACTDRQGRSRNVAASEGRRCTSSCRLRVRRRSNCRWRQSFPDRCRRAGWCHHRHCW